MPRLGCRGRVSEQGNLFWSDTFLLPGEVADVNDWGLVLKANKQGTIRDKLGSIEKSQGNPSTNRVKSSQHAVTSPTSHQASQRHPNAFHAGVSARHSPTRAHVSLLPSVNFRVFRGRNAFGSITRPFNVLRRNRCPDTASSQRRPVDWTIFKNRLLFPAHLLSLLTHAVKNENHRRSANSYQFNGNTKTINSTGSIASCPK